MESEALNIPAVAAGAVAAFVLGWVIYHPRVLGTVWANGSGVALDGTPPILAFVMQILALISLALVIGLTATVNLLGTALLAILSAALFVASGGAFQRKSNGAILTDVVYIIGAGALMIVMQGIF
ncbi:MAG: DUF1761 family protein [Silicimonas sp.]|nr:DUF1761 family protein [Silicimonas sp.]